VQHIIRTHKNDPCVAGVRLQLGERARVQGCMGDWRGEEKVERERLIHMCDMTQSLAKELVMCDMTRS